MKKTFLYFILAFVMFFGGISFADILTITYKNEQPNALIRSTRWNQDMQDIEDFINGKNLDTDDNIADGGITTAALANGAVTDIKISGITTAGLVNGSAITGLGNIPTGAGEVPTANLNVVPTSKGGTGADRSTTAQGSTLYFSATGVMSALAPGTAGQVLMTGGAAANPSFVNSLSSVADYATSASSSTARQGTAIKVAYGTVAMSGGTITVSNLPYTSTSTFSCTCSRNADATTTQAVNCFKASASTLKIQDDLAGTNAVNWMCMGT